MLAELKQLPRTRGHLRRRLARFRHAQADAGQLLRAGAADPAHLPCPDGLLQPDHGGELGIQRAVLGGAGGRNAYRAAQLNVRIPEWTQKLVEQIFASHLEDWPAAAEVAADGGRRCARAQPRRSGRRQGGGVSETPNR